MYGWRGWLAKSALLLAAVAAVAVPALGGGAATASPSVSAAGQAAASGTTTTTTMTRTTAETTTEAAVPAAVRATRPATLVAVRAGRHPSFDRLVLEFRGRVPGYRVRYVRQVLTQGQGKPIPLAGRAALEVVVRATSAYTPRDPAHLVSVRGFSALRQVAWGGSFEGYSTIGVGARARLPIRVFVLAGPGRNNRLVIDVAHHR